MSFNTLDMDAGPRSLHDLLALSHIPRWVIVPHSIPQSVADHSFRATVILIELIRRLEMHLPTLALVWALVHDAPESWTGDIPGPFKHPDQELLDSAICPWWSDIKSAVPPKWKVMFKVADLIETGTFIKKYGIGAHAGYAANHILQVELPEKVNAASEETKVDIEKLRSVVKSIVDDITTEAGRVAKMHDLSSGPGHHR